MNECTNFPEGTKAECRFCGEPILLDQQEGGGPGKDWGSDPDSWVGNGGIGMDYGCPDSPDTNEEETGGHEPILSTIVRPEREEDDGWWSQDMSDQNMSDMLASADFLVPLCSSVDGGIVAYVLGQDHADTIAAGMNSVFGVAS